MIYTEYGGLLWSVMTLCLLTLQQDSSYGDDKDVVVRHTDNLTFFEGDLCPRSKKKG